MKDGKDGFCSMLCLQHSNHDDVSIFVMHALLRSPALILASSTPKDRKKGARIHEAGDVVSMS